MVGNPDRAAQTELMELREKAAEQLAHIEGFVNVGVGLRNRAGQTTDELCFIVQVERKLSASDIPPGQRIAPELLGVPVDVQEVGGMTLFADSASYRPLQGGIQVTNSILSVAGGSGTLGCMVEDQFSGAIGILSNAHVLTIGDAKEGQTIFQPSGTLDWIAKLGTSKWGGELDAAVAWLDKGVDYEAKIVGIGDVNGSSSAVVGSAVRKRGKTTELTSGTVTAVGVERTQEPDGPKLTNQIALDLKADEGDSGSVVVDEDGKIVGLLWGGDPATGESAANDIGQVTFGLTIKIVTESGSNGGQPTSPQDNVEMLRAMYAGQASAGDASPPSPSPMLLRRTQLMVHRFHDTYAEYPVGGLLFDRMSASHGELQSIFESDQSFHALFCRTAGPILLDKNANEIASYRVSAEDVHGCEELLDQALALKPDLRSTIDLYRRVAQQADGKTLGEVFSMESVPKE